jgi:hypothetical protein
VPNTRWEVKSGYMSKLLEVRCTEMYHELASARPHAQIISNHSRVARSLVTVVVTSVKAAGANNPDDWKWQHCSDNQQPSLRSHALLEEGSSTRRTWGPRPLRYSHFTRETVDLLNVRVGILDVGFLPERVGLHGKGDRRTPGWETGW